MSPKKCSFLFSYFTFAYIVLVLDAVFSIFLLLMLLVFFSGSFIIFFAIVLSNKKKLTTKMNMEKSKKKKSTFHNLKFEGKKKNRNILFMNTTRICKFIVFFISNINIKFNMFSFKWNEKKRKKNCNIIHYILWTWNIRMEVIKIQLWTCE